MKRTISPSAIHADIDSYKNILPAKLNAITLRVPSGSRRVGKARKTFAGVHGGCSFVPVEVIEKEASSPDLNKQHIPIFAK